MCLCTSSCTRTTSFSTFGPAVRKYLWWKRYLTTLQIVQFVVIMGHMSIPLFVDCGFPKHLIMLGNVQTFIILCMFINFYVQTYKRKPSQHRLKDTNDERAAPVANGKSE
ncbi:hypothetical protein HPB48_008222 [Haemaphysalis longicornis]|uniref:Elongation of very long chain fatty acids protein n=1 Tax=Haemaphysalis longicornis TaxID=44386 RepID=A0A9J6H1U9_HAELO|nr:hypothetical protein HPB48_008222 [Haemaphysalis longicornis]